MISQAVRGLGANRLRTALTALAIALSVGLVSGTLIMGDTINATFSQVFGQVTGGVDTRVQARGFDDRSQDPRRVPASLAERVRAVDGVATAEPVTYRSGVVILDREDAPIGGGGPPQFGWTWNAADALNPFDLREGRAPRGPDEVVIDAASAEDGDYAPGDRVRISVFAGPAQEYELVGIAGFGEADNLAMATVALFDPEHAGRILAVGDTATFIDAVAEDGVSQAVLAERVQAALPAEAEAITGVQAGENLLGSVEGDIALFRNVLLGFGAIALLVAAFTIFNTFAITIAQRTRQLALYRAVGALPAQVRRLVLAEAAILGLGASIAGLALGVVLALGLFALFGALGAPLPSTDPVLAWRTAVVGLAVGVVATVAAALIPAWRASRIAPVAALRGAEAEARGVSRVSRLLGIGLTLVGAALLLVGTLGGAGLVAIFAGCLLVLVGAAFALQLLARPLVALLGSPLGRMGIAGRIARGNAMRNPRRAAVTAGALMIGLALVSLAGVFTASAKASITQLIDERFVGDYAIFSEEFSLDPALADALASDPAFSAVARWRPAELTDRSGGSERRTTLYGTDPEALESVYGIGVVAGRVSEIANGGIALHDDAAAARGLALGDTLGATVDGPRGPVAAEFEVVALFEDTTIGEAIVSLTRHRSMFGSEDEFLLLAAADPDGAAASMEAVRRDYPAITAESRERFRADAEAAADQLFTLILALLALAIVIAVLGIVNTLALSVVERTREIGLLRAVGMSRRQIGGMIRGEAVLLSLLGGVVGIAVGVSLASVLVPQVEDITLLRIPMIQIAGFIGACVVVGLVASLLPARRAARMSVVRAIGGR